MKLIILSIVFVLFSVHVFSQNYKDEKVVKNITYVQNLDIEKEDLQETSFKTTFVLAKGLLPKKLETITILVLTQKESKDGFSFIDTTYKKVKVLEHIQDNSTLCKNTLTIEIEKDVLFKSVNSRRYLQWQVNLPLIHTIETDVDGKFKTESYTYNNKHFGMSKKVAPNGDIVEIPFLNGQVHGLVTITRTGGIIQSKPYYLGEKFGQEIIRHDNGNIKSVLFFFNGLEEGVGTLYHQNGNKLNDLNYKNGLLNGDLKEYFSTGELKYETTCKNNLRQGEFTMYYINGKVNYKMIYKDGVKQGEYVKYYISGDLLGKTYFVNDKFHGEYKEYYKSGKIKAKGTYENGVKAEGWKDYDESGNEIE